MSGECHGKKISKLAENIYELYQRLGKPDTLSFLDGCICIGWCAEAESVARHAEVSVDPQFLYHTCRAPGSCREIYLYIYGDVAAIESARREIWPGKYDMAGTREGP